MLDNTIPLTTLKKITEELQGHNSNVISIEITSPSALLYVCSILKDDLLDQSSPLIADIKEFSEEQIKKYGMLVNISFNDVILDSVTTKINHIFIQNNIHAISKLHSALEEYTTLIEEASKKQKPIFFVAGVSADKAPFIYLFTATYIEEKEKEYKIKAQLVSSKLSSSGLLTKESEDKDLFNALPPIDKPSIH